MTTTPKGASAAKMASRGEAIVFAFVGALLLLSGLAVSVSSVMDMPTWYFVGWMLFGAIFLDGGWRIYRQTSAIQEEDLTLPKAQGILADSARVIGRVSAYKSMFDSVLLSLIVLVVFGTLSAIALSQGASFIEPSRLIFGLGVILGYFLLLSPILRFLGSSLNTKTRSWMSHFELIPDGLRIHFNIKAVDRSDEKFMADIRFSELTEVALLDFREAEAFYKYQLGPDAGLHMKGVKDLIAFTKREIQRPHYYFESPATNATGTLKLVGPDIFYLVLVNNENYDELLAAFERSKKQQKSVRSDHE